MKNIKCFEGLDLHEQSSVNTRPALVRPGSVPLQDEIDETRTLSLDFAPHSCRAHTVSTIAFQMDEVEEADGMEVYEVRGSTPDPRYNRIILKEPDFQSLSLIDFDYESATSDDESIVVDEEMTAETSWLSSVALTNIDEIFSRSHFGSIMEIVEEGSQRPSLRSGDYVRFDEGTMGKGACGSIKRALFIPTCEVVALKETPLSDVTLAQSTRESSILMRDDVRKSNHIINAMNSGYEEDMFVMSMEYMSGGDLHKHIKRNGPLSEQTVAVVMIHASRALHDLKTFQIVHGDVTAKNILLTKNGTVKLSDFGTASDVSGSDGYTGKPCGTVSCLSPERCRGEKYTFSADVFSLGIVAWHCFLGNEPLGELTWSIPNHARLCQEQLTGRVSNEAMDFMQLCLDHNADRRPTAKQLLTHPFLSSSKEQIPDFIGDPDSELLKKIIRTLVDYYKRRSFLDELEPAMSPSLASSDDEKVLNIAASTGFSPEEVSLAIAKFAGIYRLSFLKT